MKAQKKKSRETGEGLDGNSVQPHTLEVQNGGQLTSIIRTPFIDCMRIFKKIMISYFFPSRMRFSVCTLGQSEPELEH